MNRCQRVEESRRVQGSEYVLNPSHIFPLNIHEESARIRLMTLNRIVLCVLAAGMLVGCEPESPTPTPVSTPASTQVPTSMPAAESKVDEPKVSVPIRGTKLSLMLPRSWKVESIEGGTVTDGPTPGGRAMLSGRKVSVKLSPAQIEAMMKQVNAEQTALPATLPATGSPQYVKSWTVGEHVFIQTITRPAREITQYRPNPTPGGSPVPFVTQVVQWEVKAYLRDTLDYTLVDLQWTDFTQEQFAKDRAFIESVLDSIKVEP
jgi:hypothetical protein